MMATRCVALCGRKFSLRSNSWQRVFGAPICPHFPSNLRFACHEMLHLAVICFTRPRSLSPPGPCLQGSPDGLNWSTCSISWQRASCMKGVWLGNPRGISQATTFPFKAGYTCSGGSEDPKRLCEANAAAALREAFRAGFCQILDKSTTASANSYTNEAIGSPDDQAKR